MHTTTSNGQLQSKDHTMTLVKPRRTNRQKDTDTGKRPDREGERLDRIK